MHCIKPRALENEEEIKSITFKDELKVIGEKLGGAQDDFGISIIPVMLEWVVLGFAGLYFLFKKKSLFSDRINCLCK